MRKFKCSICGYVYDEAAGIPKKSIAPGTKWEDISDDFVCLICNASKSAFKSLEENEATPTTAVVVDNTHAEELKELSAGEISVICSNLAKGCEKQQLAAEMEAFNKIAEYYKKKSATEHGKTLNEAAKILDGDLADGIMAANTAAKAEADRGALRSLVWSEKVGTMMKILFERFDKEGDAMLENTRIFVCDICGFIYIGDVPPEMCPVCKVPSFKITQVERR